MSEYTDFWKSLDLPADQSPKTRDFNTVASNTDKLSLTDAEQYSLGWGPDALPEDWVKQRAKEINDQIQAAESTAILRRGLNTKGKTQEEIDAEAAAKALEEAKAKEAVNTPGAPRVDNSGGGDGNSGPTGSTGPAGGINQEAMALAGMALAENKALQAYSPIGTAVLGGISRGLADNAIGAAGVGIDSMNANAALGGIAGTGIGVKSDDQGRISTYSNPATIAAQDAANFGGSDAGMGGATEGSAGSTAATSDSPDGPDGNNAGQGFGGNDGGGGGDSGGGGGANSDGGTGDTGSDGNGGGGTGDGDN
jgi:hypothetical protein